jgi:NAD-dependent deacetylase
MTEKQPLQELLDLLESSRRIRAFTGAGISTLSGIPDFRGDNGVFSKTFKGYDAEEIHEIGLFRKHPEIFYEYAKDFTYNLSAREPNLVHYTLAQMQQQNRLGTIYTQNIDNLHQRAGSLDVREFHGSMVSHHCLECETRFCYAEIVPVVRSGQVPHCRKCGGLIKPDIVFFGESPDSELLESAFADLERTDLLLVLGSSLTVPPAANLPMATYYGGGKIVIVNRQPTGLDRHAHLKFDDLQEVFSAVAEWLKRQA